MKELDVVTMKNIEGGADPILITGIVTMVIAFCIRYIKWYS